MSKIEDRPAPDLEDAIAAALAIFGRGTSDTAAAVKVGMLPGGEAVDAVLRALSRHQGAVVVDPVLSASRGGRLFRAPVSRLWPLLRRATLVTPNARELEAIAGRHSLHTLEEAMIAGAGLLASGITALLIKGGHFEGDDAVDVLMTRDGTIERHERPRLTTAGEIRGTGCALATAIAVGLSRGWSMSRSVRTAKEWLHHAIGAAHAVGPEHHLGR